MNIFATTSVFLDIRPDRTPNYYLRPYYDFIKRFANSEINFVVFVNFDPLNMPYMKNQQVIQIEPQLLLKRIWVEDHWQQIYFDIIKENPTHCKSFQARYPRLIAVYLSKIEIIRRIFEMGADVVLWFDAGHWVSHLCNHDINLYTSELQNGILPTHIIAELKSMTDKFGIIGCQSEKRKQKFHMPLSWMHDYIDELGYINPDTLPLYQGMFMLIHRKSHISFFDGFVYWWNRLIEDRKAGTEENALTLLGWQKNILSYPYSDWIRFLKGKTLNKSCCDNYLIR